MTGKEGERNCLADAERGAGGEMRDWGASSVRTDAWQNSDTISPAGTQARGRWGKAGNEDDLQLLGG